MILLTWDGSKWIPDSSINVDIANNSSLIQGNTTRLDNLVINNCTDVDTTTVAPTTDDTLTWNGTNWVPDSSINTDITKNSNDITQNSNDIASNLLLIQGNTSRLDILTINDCTDVNTTSLSVDDTLTWNGTNWVPDSSVNADITQNATNIASNLVAIQANNYNKFSY